MDRDIRAAVCQELDADRLIDAADIVVEVVNGEVSLNGTVPSQDQRKEAATAARRVAGVTGVDNLLDVALPVGDYLEDAALAQRVNGALAARGVADGIRVTAREGDVLLTGTVRDIAQRGAAEDAAAGVGGVVSITNLIEVQDGVLSGPLEPWRAATFIPHGGTRVPGPERNRERCRQVTARARAGLGGRSGIPCWR